MDKEHLKGAAKKAEGQIKETAGKLTGDGMTAYWQARHSS